MGLFDFFKKGNKPASVSTTHSNSMEPIDGELKEEVLEVIKQEVKFGFDHEAEILETIWTMGFENEDQLNETWLQQMIAKDYHQHQLESKQWPRPTDFDSLAKVFDKLNSEKIIALHKAGYTKQDGYSDVAEVVDVLKAKDIVPLGYCFYHTQDLERAVDPASRNLFLAFDDIEQNTDRAIAIGKRMVSLLQEHGLKTEWDGTIEQRIEIKDITWQKTPDNQDWGMARAIEYLSQGE
jgi:hypothetical protein